MKFKLNDKTTNVLAVCLIVFMGVLAFGSMLEDSVTMDELAHVPAGYSYIARQDMRLNPEHPPLLKDLAGISVWLGSKISGNRIHFPVQAESWQEDVNGQWDFGREFLHQSGNDLDQIILWARLPMILIMLLLGFYIFKWSREIYGNQAGLIALFLYSFSPTFLAHGRLVTTDVGAAAAFFIAIYYLVKWLKRPSILNIIIAGVALALALLTKFSLILLGPLFAFLIFIWAFAKALPIVKERFFSRRYFVRTLGITGTTVLSLLILGVIALLVIWPLYALHVWDYPPERQYRDTQFILQSFGKRWLAEPVIWMSNKPVLRACGQFFFGILMVVQRAVGGNTTFFLGEISAAGWKTYFPIVFLIKVPLALIALILITTLKSIKKPVRETCRFIKAHFSQFALLVFFAVYWALTLRSNLNIGVRHVLPTFPVIYVLASGGLTRLTKNRLWRSAIIILLIWYAAGTLMVYPSFLTYFNESVGGPERGYLYVTDSNLDWGQDLKRLTKFVEKNNIKTIYVDYFGGDSPEHRLGDKFQSWWGSRDPNELPPDSWLAVSATFLQGGRGLPTVGYKGETGYYNWLNQYKPAAVIGNSIFVYKID